MLGRWDTHPLTDLTGVFVAWKAFLIAIAAGTAVGPRYDTSGSLLDLGRDGPASPLLVQRLTSWDALYFVQVARRGYLFEQEWAFGSGLPLLINSIQKGLGFFGLGRDVIDAAVVGVVVANLSHFLAVLALYRLAKLLTRDQKLAFVAACLHVLSPAGVFLSAPFAESTFALLTFAGYLAFSNGILSSSCVPRDGLIVISGALFGLATAFRSNGILNGILFASFALDTAKRLVQKPSLPTLIDLGAMGLGGVLVATGTIVPQYVAYQRYCVEAAATALGAREWCSHRLPSIYNFVQEYYWDNGFLRYWKTSNIPLFAMAAPMVLVLLRSGVVTLSQPRAAPKAGDAARSPEARLLDVLWCMAASQVVLAVLAVLNHHIQIISRISSGLPLWYLWLGRRILLEAKAGLPANNMLMFMLMYAPVQAALFGAFLPPA